MNPSDPRMIIGRGGCTVEIIEFNGISYRRNPKSTHVGSRDYYRVTIQGITRRLHRDIWEYHNGPIPDGSELGIIAIQKVKKFD